MMAVIPFLPGMFGGDLLPTAFREQATFCSLVIGDAQVKRMLRETPAGVNVVAL